jgi:hypothetical protein
MDDDLLAIPERPPSLSLRVPGRVHVGLEHATTVWHDMDAEGAGMGEVWFWECSCGVGGEVGGPRRGAARAAARHRIGAA